MAACQRLLFAFLLAASGLGLDLPAGAQLAGGRSAFDAHPGLIADYPGLTPETVSRVFAGLEGAAAIERPAANPACSNCPMSQKPRASLTCITVG